MPCYQVILAGFNPPRIKTVDTESKAILTEFLKPFIVLVNSQPSLVVGDAVTVPENQIDLLLSQFGEPLYEDIKGLHKTWTPQVLVEHKWNSGGRHRFTGDKSFDDDCTVLLDGKRFDHKYSCQWRNHSPDGFSWGYTGSGPAQLALAILLQETADPQLSLYLYQTYKNSVISQLPDEFVITSDDVREWIAKHG